LQHTAFTPEARSLDAGTLVHELRGAGFEDVAVDEMIPQMTKLSVARKPG
jgi:hypothetical protein